MRNILKKSIVMIMMLFFINPVYIYANDNGSSAINSQDISATTKITNNTTGEVVLQEVKLKPTMISKLKNDIGFESYKVEYSVSISFNDERPSIMPYTSESTSKDDGTCVAYATVYYDASPQTGKLRVTRATGGWKNQPLIIVRDRYVFLKDAFVSANALVKYPEGYSFDYTTGWDWRSYNNRASIYTQATIIRAGHSEDSHLLELTYVFPQ